MFVCRSVKNRQNSVCIVRYSISAVLLFHSALTLAFTVVTPFDLKINISPPAFWDFLSLWQQRHSWLIGESKLDVVANLSMKGCLYHCGSFAVELSCCLHLCITDNTDYKLNFCFKCTQKS